MFTTFQRYAVAAVVGALLLFGIWLYWVRLQDTIEQLTSDVKTQTDRAELAAKVAASAVSSQVIVTKTVEKIVEVKVKGDTIVQKVPVYVPSKADSSCVVTNGAVSLFNSAAANVLLPADSNGVPDGPSGVALSTIAGTTAEWASRYYQLAERYKGLRAWTEAQGAICRGGGEEAQK